jgi:hypothetical protein
MNPVAQQFVTDDAAITQPLKSPDAKIKYDAERPPHLSPVMLTVTLQIRRRATAPPLTSYAYSYTSHTQWSGICKCPLSQSP